MYRSQTYQRTMVLVLVQPLLVEMHVDHGVCVHEHADAVDQGPPLPPLQEMHIVSLYV